MAVDLSKLVSKRKITIDELGGKIIAIDAYNVLYQFLSIIRQPDGMPFTDHDGNVTSHMSGLFYRTIDIIEKGVKPIYVFDGLPSVLKEKTIAARMRRREESYNAWQEAKEKGDIEKAKSFAQGSTRVNKAIVESAKALLDTMGVFYINAPSEGEAQASIMCRERLTDATASQDYDTLLFGSPVIIRNMAMSGRRKLPGKNIYVNIEPEMINLDDTLKSLQVNHDQLIWIGLMLGTDFNDGIKGIGPKTALKIAKSSNNKSEMVSYIKEKYNAEFESNIDEIIGLFKNPEVKHIKKEEMETGLRKKPDKEKIIDFMCNMHDFSKERVEKYADRLVKMSGSARQQGINRWF